MHRMKPFYRYGLLSLPMMLLSLFLFLNLLISANLASAQNSSHNGKQWRSVGGKKVFSDEGDFSNKWLAATRYFHGDGKYWKNDEPTSDPTTHKKIPATHTLEEVTKDVWVLQGQITVQGPGYLGLFMRSKGAGAVLKDHQSEKVFITQGLGKDEWLHDAHNNWKWYPGEVVNIDPSQTLGGWVPAGRTIALDVWAYNPFSDWGVWGNGYGAPKSVEYEFWFFPRKGGEIVKVIKYCPGGITIDTTTGDKPCPTDQKRLCEDLKKTLLGYARCRDLTMKSIGAYKKQIDVLSRHSTFNTGYYNEYQNNTLGNDPNWNKQYSTILQYGAGGSPSVGYLYNKDKWKEQLNKSIQIQTQNLRKTDSEIARIKHEMQQRGCQ